MKRLVPVLFLLLAALSSAFGESKWKASEIADSLKKHANAVVRMYQTTYDRKDIEDYSKSVHLVVTVLNKKGDDASELVIPYDKNSSVKDLDIFLYDGSGGLIKKSRKKDIRDYAYNNSYTLFSDNRVKYCHPSSTQYPYTVECFYTVDHKGVVGFAPWFPNLSFGMSVEQAELTFSTPDNLSVKYKPLNHDFELDSSLIRGIRQYHWQISNLKAVRHEVQCPEIYDLLPCILLSPEDISYEGTTGNFTSWEKYGNWVYSLINGRDMVSAETQAKMKQLTDSISDQRGKVKAIYKYMQSKTRYVNVALGIGGFQPIMAVDVDDKGYGDCKALSNYTKALLESVGIDAFYTEIGNGSRQKIRYPGFPSANQTNHVILCVPLKNDSVWLECTSQNMPFGYIGTGNADRYALLITPDGGQLAHTPVYGRKDNLRQLKAKVNLDADGHADLQLNARFEDHFYEAIFYLMVKSAKEQKDYLLKHIKANSLVINNFKIEDCSNKNAEANLHLDGHVGRYAIKTGQRMFVMPNFLFGNDYLKSIPDNREQSLYQPFGYQYNDSVTINFPSGYQLDYLPKQVEMDSSFGRYTINYEELPNHAIRVTRLVQINKGTYGKSLFESVNSFLKKVRNADNNKIVLKKLEG
ncbi:MAG TPA: DUF3857 domain-containing protein [Sunxiuqinia sp.]|nr:DUF3857 domain-containing protein [Sunxiuqinia sp.]